MLYSQPSVNNSNLRNMLGTARLGIIIGEASVSESSRTPVVGTTDIEMSIESVEDLVHDNGKPTV